MPARAGRTAALTVRGAAAAELVRRAHKAEVSPSHLAGVILAREFGVEPPSKPKWRSAERASGDVVRAVGDGATVAEVAGSLGLREAVAREWLRRAKAGGLVTARRGPWPSARGGSSPVVYRPTALGRRVAEAD